MSCLIAGMPTTLITGSASGIGAATRALLEAAGHHVLGIDRHQAEIVADLSTPTGRQHALAQALQQCRHRLDHLVLCAGLGPATHPADHITAVNYYGVVDLLDGCLPVLAQGLAPAAVVLSSIASVQLPWVRNTLGKALVQGDAPSVQSLLEQAGEKASRLAYAASKNAVTVALRQRALAWAQAGVRLNSVAPGSVQTPMLHASLQDPRLVDSIGQNPAPLRPAARAEEIASVIAFLLSPGASYVHGTQVHVDGGKDAMLRPHQF